MTKGVVSPWAKPEQEAPEEEAARKVVESPEGVPRRTMTFQGRAFQITVGFLSFDRDKTKLMAYANDALGRALEAALIVDGTLRAELTRQAIHTDPDKVLAAKVTMSLGPLRFYVKASSFDQKMATLMALDRLALAITAAQAQSAALRTSFTDHDIVVARIT